MYGFLDIVLSIVVFLAPQNVTKIQIWPYAADPSERMRELKMTYSKGTNGWCVDYGETNMGPCLIITDGKLMDDHGKVLLNIKDNLKSADGTNYVFKPKEFENPLEFSVRESRDERTIEVREKGKIVRELRVKMGKSNQTGLPFKPVLKEIQPGYDEDLTEATNSIPFAADFVRIFPGAGCFFNYDTSSTGPPSLIMASDLFNRYQLSLRVPVTFDENRRKVKSFGEPVFLLNEISEVKKENWGVSYNVQNQRRFGSNEWRKIVAAQGDFSIVGYRILTNSPVPGFDALRKSSEMRMKKQP